ncbi:MAG: hypothetical protein WA322_05070 [Pseudolabrys sp.]
MSALGLSLIAFACIFGTTLLSMFCSQRLAGALSQLRFKGCHTTKHGSHRGGREEQTSLLLHTQARNAIPLPFLVLLACHYFCKLQPFRIAQPDCCVRIFCLCVLGGGRALSHF